MGDEKPEGKEELQRLAGLLLAFSLSPRPEGHFQFRLGLLLLCFVHPCVGLLLEAPPTSYQKPIVPVRGLVELWEGEKKKH